MLNTKQIPIKYSQNFYCQSRWLPEIISQKTHIGENDIVVDIGAGRGELTQELAKHAKKVIAYELDPVLYRGLQISAKVTAYNRDFIREDTAKFGKYKVFANIPFFLTAAIVRKLFLESRNAPKEAHLFMQQEAAYRLIGKPYEKDTILPLMLKPFWDIRISHTFKRTDFNPVPNVDVVLVSFYPKENPSIRDREKYQDFVSYTLNRRKANIKLALLDLFTFKQLVIIARELQLDLKAAPGSLTAEQWEQLWYRFEKLVEPFKQAQITGAYNKLCRHQIKLNQEKEIISFP